MTRWTVKTLAGIAATVVAAGLASEWIGAMADLSPMRIIRWVALSAATIIVSVIFVVMLKGLWALDESSAKVKVAPFTIIDPSGDMANAETGLASLLVARIAHIQADIERSRNQLAGAQKNGTKPSALETLEAAAYGTPGLPAETTRPPLLADMFATDSSSALPEFSVQGVDLTGLFSWVKRNLRDQQKAIHFTAYVDKTDGVSIAGDIAQLGLGDAAKTLFLRTEKGETPAVAVDLLAHLIYQHALSATEPQVMSLTPHQFQSLIEALAELENPQQDYWEEDRRREHIARQYKMIDTVLGRFEEWPKLSIVAGRAAWLAGQNENAQNHFQSALTVARRNENTELIAAIEYHLEQVDGALSAPIILASAKTRTIPAVVRPTTRPTVHPAPPLVETVETTDAPKPYIRKSVSDLSDSELATLREGFAALQSTRGDRSLNAFAGIYRQYLVRTHNNELFLPWNRAFLALVETEVRKEVPEFALACWDFNELKVPEAFTVDQIGTQANPLAFGIVTAGSTEKVADPRKTQRRRTDLSTSNAVRFQSDNVAILNAEWELAHTQIEQQLNNARHVLVGGDMASATTSVFDPLFFAHRCAVDRFWARWQANRTGAPYSSDLLNRPLEPFGLTVNDVIWPNQLGYSYEIEPTQ